MPPSPMTVADGQDTQVLYGNFAFHVQFVDGGAAFAPRGSTDPKIWGAFAEISGLEASMEHKMVRQGGQNYGAPMLTGPVSFGTVILKRGIARSQTLWRWWSMFAGADDRPDGRPIAANRCSLLIGLITPPGFNAAAPAPTPSPPAGRSASGGAGGAGAAAAAAAAPPQSGTARSVAMGWRLHNVMPVKFRVGDLNARGSDVAVEELHLVHEGLHVAGVVA